MRGATVVEAPTLLAIQGGGAGGRGVAVDEAGQEAAVDVAGDRRVVRGGREARHRLLAVPASLELVAVLVEPSAAVALGEVFGVEALDVRLDLGHEAMIVRCHDSPAGERGRGAQSSAANLELLVLALDDEERTADRARELGLLARELEGTELLGYLHPLAELEPDRSLGCRPVEGVEHVDREAALVKDVGPADVLDLERRRFEGRRRDHDVALQEDPTDEVDRLLGRGGRFDREVVVVLVLEVAGLIGP